MRIASDHQNELPKIVVLVLNQAEGLPRAPEIDAVTSAVVRLLAPKAWTSQHGQAEESRERHDLDFRQRETEATRRWIE
jgi:hypothetical protein